MTVYQIRMDEETDSTVLYAIKAFRLMFGIGLRDAKEIVRNRKCFVAFEGQVSLFNDLMYLRAYEDKIAHPVENYTGEYIKIDRCHAHITHTHTYNNHPQ